MIIAIGCILIASEILFMIFIEDYFRKKLTKLKCKWVVSFQCALGEYRKFVSETEEQNALLEKRKRMYSIFRATMFVTFCIMMLFLFPTLLSLVAGFVDNIISL